MDAKRLKLLYKFCPHCQKQCNIKTYKDHKRLYFNVETKSWITATSSASASAKQSVIPEEVAYDTDSSLSHDSDADESQDIFFLTPSPATDPDMYAGRDDLLSEADANDDPKACDNDAEYWEESNEEIDMEFMEPSSVPPSPAQDGTQASPEDFEVKTVVWWIVAFISLFQTLHVIPDRAVAWLVKFIAILLKYFGRSAPKLQKVAVALPQSLYCRNKFLLDGNCLDIRKYVVCPSCHSLHHLEDLYTKIGAQVQVKRCPSKQLASNCCNSEVLKKVYTVSGNLKLYPHKVYCYSSLIASLQRLLLRPEFVSACERTRHLCCEATGSLADVYHGKMWREFLSVHGDDFLSASFCYGFILNIDWFQPYKGCIYKVGVIYLAIMNLPRSQRYKRQNILVVGIIPGPSEPPLSINSYLSPMIDELLQLWQGILLKVHNCGERVVRAALLAVACDIPAGRKVCGFLSHKANFGCSRCYCSFSEGGLQRNYSFFNRSSWKLRSNQQHREDASKLLQCKTHTERTKLESQLGCRFSVLLDLPYFDPVRMMVIDPMHNLFLGSAKYFTQNILINTGILDKPKLLIIQERIKSVIVPVNIGRLPTNIESGATFTAHQWMNWTLYLSVYCLHGLISQDHLECWRSFVLACRRLCKRSVTQSDVTVADLLLMQFCKRVSRLFGNEFVTPNMHLHYHLADCIRDFGPLHGFWVYAFERYNGLLGNLPTNNRAIELQLMQRFTRDNITLDLINQAESMDLLDEFGEVVLGHAKEFHSVGDPYTADNNQCSFPPKYRLTVLDKYHTEELKRVYSSVYPQYSIVSSTSFPSTCRKYEYVVINDRKISSSSENSPSYVMVKPVFPFPSSSIQPMACDPRPAQVQHFIMHSFQASHLDSSTQSYVSHAFAICKWPLHHPEQHIIGKPVQVWCKSLYEPSFINTVIPIENIITQTLFAFRRINEETVVLLVPLCD